MVFALFSHRSYGSLINIRYRQQAVLFPELSQLPRSSLGKSVPGDGVLILPCDAFQVFPSGVTNTQIYLGRLQEIVDQIQSAVL